MLQRFEDPRGYTNRVEIVLLRIISRRIALGENTDHRLAEVFNILYQRDGLLTSDIKG